MSILDIDGKTPEVIRKELHRIKGQTKCLKAFECLEDEPEKLCKARDLGMEAHIECLDHLSDGCSFSTPFGDGRFCRCPLRVFLAKKLGKSEA